MVAVSYQVGGEGAGGMMRTRSRGPSLSRVVLMTLAAVLAVAVSAALAVHFLAADPTCSTFTCAAGSVPDGSATETLCASDPCTSADQSTCCNDASGAQTCGGKKDELHFCQAAPGAAEAAYVIPPTRFDYTCTGVACTAAECCVDACSDENISVPMGGSAALTPDSQCKRAEGHGMCVPDPTTAPGQQEWMCECWAPWQSDPALGTPNCNHNVREHQVLDGSGFQGSGFDTDCRCEGETCTSANIQACQQIRDADACEAQRGAQGCIWDPPEDFASSLCVGPFKDQCYSPAQRSYIDAPETGCADATDSANVPHTTFVPMHVQGCEKDATNRCSPPCTLIDDPCVPTDAGSDTECYFDVSTHQCIDGCHIDPSKLATCEAPTDAPSTLQCSIGSSINDGICQEGCILNPGLMCNSLTGTNEATCVAPLGADGKRDPASEAKCNSINLYTEDDLELNATVAPGETVSIGQFSVRFISGGATITTHTRENAPSLNVGDRVRVIYNSSDKYKNTIVTITAAPQTNQYTVDQGLPDSIIGNGSIYKVSSVNANPGAMSESEQESATCISEGCDYNAAGTSPCTFDEENNCPEGCLSQIAGEGNSWIEHDFKLSCHVGSSVTVWGSDEIDLSICGRGEAYIEQAVVGECRPGEIPVYWEGTDGSGSEQQNIGARQLCGCWSACTDACENITSEYNQSFQHYRLFPGDQDRTRPPESIRMQKPTDGWASTRVGSDRRHPWDSDGKSGTGATVAKQMIDASCGFERGDAQADRNDPRYRCPDPFYEDLGGTDGTSIYAHRGAPKMKPGDGIRKWWLGELQRSLGAGEGLAEAAPGASISPPYRSLPPFLGYEGEGRSGSYFPDEAIAAGSSIALSRIDGSELQAHVPPAMVSALNAGGAGSTTAADFAGLEVQRPVWQSRVYIPKVMTDGSRAAQYCHSREFGRSPQIIYPPPCFGETGSLDDRSAAQAIGAAPKCNSCDITSTEAAQGVIDVQTDADGVTSWKTSAECSVEIGSLHRYPNFMDLKPRCLKNGEYIDDQFDVETCETGTSCVDDLKKNHLPQKIRQYEAQGEAQQASLNSIEGRYHIESIKESQCQSNAECPPWTGTTDKCTDAGGTWILETPSYIKCGDGNISGLELSDTRDISTCACPRGKKAKLKSSDTWECVDWESTDVPDVGYPW